MAGINDGQAVDAANSNPAWLAKNGDDFTVGTVGLKKSGGASGGFVDDAQKEINNIATATGLTTNQALGTLPTFTNNQGLTATETIKARAEELSAKFHNSSGHAHDGSLGGGAPISAASIINVVLKGYAVKGVDIASPSGSSINVTSLMTGKTASSGAAVEGVVVTAPYNNVILRVLSGTNAGDSLTDTAGNIVYGRITFASAVWTLNFYVNIAGTETAYTLTAGQTTAGIVWYYQQLANPIVTAPVYSDLFFTPSENATADVVDASTTQRGLINTTSQSFSGQKNFTSGAKLIDSATEIYDSTDATKKILFDAGGTTGTSTTLLSSQTTNKTLTLPDATDTLVARNTTDVLTNKTLSGNTASNLINGAGTFNFNSTGTITTPNATDTLVARNTTDTLTNKTLTAPVISTIVNTGTLTLPTSTDTLVGRSTADTLTNKSISGSTNTITNVSLTTGVTGTLPIANGGTNATTANSALNNLLPAQTGNAGKALQTDGTNASWVTPNAGTVTNVTGSAPISVANGTSTPAISITQSSATTNGYLSSTDWNTFNNKQNGSAELTGVSALSTTGYVKRTGAGTYTTTTTVSATTEISGTLPIANGGTGQTTQTAAFNALSPISTKGDLITNDGTNDVALPVGTNGFVLTADSTQTSGLKWAAASATTFITPTVQRFTSGAGTYVRPTSPTPIYLRVRLIGGGGGGGGSGTGGGTGGTGTSTTFGTALLTGGGGVGGQGAGGAGTGGGAATASAPAITVSLNIGAAGGAGTQLVTSTGGTGASSYFGGGGLAGQGNGNPGSAPTNTNSGTGGGGGGGTAGAASAGGGQAGGFVEAIILSPNATYPVSVGTGGAGGTAGTSGGAGGAGAAGVIIIEEFYQ